MVCPVKNLARGCPLCRSFSKKLRKSAETEPEKPKNAQKKSNFSKTICARNLAKHSMDASSNAWQLCNLSRSAPGNPRWDIGRQTWKSWKKAIFGPKNRVFGQQNDFSGQNGSRDLFLYHQVRAACKISGKSDGPFPRSILGWNYRLMLSD